MKSPIPPVSAFRCGSQPRAPEDPFAALSGVAFHLRVNKSLVAMAVIRSLSLKSPAS